MIMIKKTLNSVSHFKNTQLPVCVDLGLGTGYSQHDVFMPTEIFKIQKYFKTFKFHSQKWDWLIYNKHYYWRRHGAA